MRTARTVGGKIRIVHQLETERRDLFRLCAHDELLRGLRRRVALREEAAVLEQQIFLPAHAVGERCLQRVTLRLLLSTHLRRPRVQALAPVRMFHLDAVFNRANTTMHLCDALLLRRSVHHAARLVVVVQEREHLVILLLRDGIVFVVVALAAVDREAEDALPDRVHAVEHRLHAELLGVHAAFFVHHRIPQEAGCDDLILRGIRQLIARELLDDELIVRQITIERIDHPVSIEPDVAHRIFLVAIRVRVACGIQPVATPALAVMRR